MSFFLSQIKSSWDTRVADSHDSVLFTPWRSWHSELNIHVYSLISSVRAFCEHFLNLTSIKAPISVVISWCSRSLFLSEITFQLGKSLVNAKQFFKERDWWVLCQYIHTHSQDDGWCSYAPNSGLYWTIKAQNESVPWYPIDTLLISKKSFLYVEKWELN